MVLSCGVAFISYLDRAIMGVTILPVAAAEGYTKSVEGFISRYADRLSESRAYAVQPTGPLWLIVDLRRASKQKPAEIAFRSSYALDRL